jgi:alanine racemase
MNPHPPSNSLRWVDISLPALHTALDEAAERSHALDIRADAYGFGEDRVSAIAREKNLGVVDGSPLWVEKAHAHGAQRLRAKVVHVKQVPPGESVSYGGHFTTTRPTTLALISIGFADGVPRLDPVGGEIELAGRRVPITGRIAMDQMIVDATGVDVSPGDVATIWGGMVTLQEWAGWSGRSVFEIGSTLAARVVVGDAR